MTYDCVCYTTVHIIHYSDVHVQTYLTLLAHSVFYIEVLALRNSPPSPL